MKRLIALLALSAMFVVGCQSGGEELSEKDKKSFQEAVDAGKKPFDINNVPPEKREMVRGFMQQNQAPASAQGSRGN
jgi:PBP1b-binding outer membrane lipoprotein LpoB